MKLWIVLLGDETTLRPMGDGETMEMRGKERPQYAYGSAQRAEEKAKELATKNPESPVYIFEAVGAIQTKSPQFIEKEFNKTGELIPRG